MVACPRTDSTEKLSSETWDLGISYMPVATDCAFRDLAGVSGQRYTCWKA